MIYKDKRHSIIGCSSGRTSGALEGEGDGAVPVIGDAPENEEAECQRMGKVSEVVDTLDDRQRLSERHYRIKGMPESKKGAER